MTAVPRIASITFDCENAHSVTAFWASVLDRTVDDGASKEFASMSSSRDGEPVWSFMAVPEPKTAKNRLHLDLEVDDLHAEAERITGLGAARLAEVEEGGYRWITLADPGGNEFDIVVRVP